MHADMYSAGQHLFGVKMNTRKPALARIALTGGKTMLMDLRPPAHLLSPWLRRGSIALLHAQPKTGKTYFALKAALAVSAGDDFLGWKPGKPGRSRKVLYIDAEMPLWLMQKRLRQLGCDADNRDLVIVSREQAIASDLAMPDLGSKDGQEELNAYIDYIEPDLIVLDSLSALIRTGAENERESWLPIENWLQRQRAYQRAVLMIHHQGKSGLQRGTSSRMEVLDAELSLRKGERGALQLTLERVRDHDGPLVSPLTVRLEIGKEGASWRNVGRKAGELSPVRAQVCKLLKAGKKASEIAKVMSKARATIYEHERALKAAGLV
jgi:hypothetical protein